MSENGTYYYHLLNKEQQRAYHAIYEGIRAIEPSFAVPKLSGREFADIFFQVRLDHPEIFWASSFRYKFYPQADNVEFIPEYLFPKAKIKEHQAALTSRVAKLVRAAEGKNEKEKEQYIHDFICQSVHYDKLKKPYSHEIIGALGQGVAVCEGIAKAVKILCDRLGIWCIIALCDANREKGIKYRHTWNIVKIGGKYYHLDATFDLSLSGADGIRYDYYNISDRNVFRDHEPVIWRIPACEDSSASWYQEKKISFTKPEDVRKRAAQFVKKEKTFLFHWRGGYLTRAVLEELLTILSEEAKLKGKDVRISLNWPQAVIKAGFVKAETEAEASAAVPAAEDLQGVQALEYAEAAQGLDDEAREAKRELKERGMEITFEEANEGELYEES